MFNIDRWAKSIEGKKLDLDGYPTYQTWQCHDVWLSYLYALGGKPGDGHAGGDGYTHNVWLKFPTHRPSLAALFTRHDASQIRRGDAVFYNNFAGSGIPHVIVALSDAKKGSFLGVDQNPRAVSISRRTVRGAIGVLRPKQAIKGRDSKVTTDKSIDQLAKEVIAGKHGVGAHRRRSLGKKYDAVQARVNQILRSGK